MNTKPTWITLYAIGMIGIGAMFCVPLLHVAPLVQTFMYLLIVAALYGTIGMWIEANSAALETEGLDDNDTYTIHWDVARVPVEVEASIPETETPDTHNRHQEAA